jgi:Ca2+-binding EF-hand superfamily protein
MLLNRVNARSAASMIRPVVLASLIAVSGCGQSGFSGLDRNGDGKISLQEADTNPALKAQFSRFDNNGNGSIQPSEFSAFEARQGSNPGN